MCIIAYKPKDTKMIDKSILETCFDNNPDGAGFMFIKNNKVHIKKGFMNFNTFYRALTTYKSIWKKSPFVIHFRISTQAGINAECTHPFPLSNDMNELKKLKSKCDIGIAHNGIISLTSNYWNKTITYSDTMEFITDYLSLIIDDKNYYKNSRKLKLIERLADSKLCILSNDGHCEMIGKFTKDNGIYYSNDSYIDRPTIKSPYNWNDIDDIDDDDNRRYIDNLYDDIDDMDDDIIKKEVSPYYDYATDRFYFDTWCPVELYDCHDYCEKCFDYKKCKCGINDDLYGYEYCY